MTRRENMSSKPIRTLEIGSESEEETNIAQPDTDTAEIAQNTKGNKTIFTITINILTLALVTISAVTLFGKDVLSSDWYWIAIFAIAITCLNAWAKGEVSTKTAEKVSVTFCVIASLMAAFTAIWPNFNIKELGAKKNAVSAEIQIPVEISRGWRIDSEGRLVANLQPGEEATRAFHLQPHESTPVVFIPGEENYRFRFTNLQTVCVDNGRVSVIVHPEDYYDMGMTPEAKIFKITALEKGADITINIRRI